MSSKPTLHLIGLFHTQTSREFSHCAFTGKVLRFPKMMRPFGYRVIEYCNEGSESEADEHVTMLTRGEFEEMGGFQKPGEFHGNNAVIGSPMYQLFTQRLIRETSSRRFRSPTMWKPA
jgi:hypothetical protein